MTAHTCIDTAPAGGIAPPCVGCGERFKAKLDAEREIILAAQAFYRRNPHIERGLASSLDSAVAKLIALGISDDPLHPTADSRAMEELANWGPMEELVRWAKLDCDRHFDIRYISGIEFPWAVTMSNDAVSWSVTVDCHSSFEKAVKHAFAEAHKEEP